MVEAGDDGGFCQCGVMVLFLKRKSTGVRIEVAGQ